MSSAGTANLSDVTHWDMAFPSWARPSPGSGARPRPVLPRGIHSVPPGPPAGLSLAHHRGLGDMSPCPRGPHWPPLAPAAPAASLPFLNRGSPKLISAIYADYARSLKNLGFKQGALLFASKAGAAGRDLLNELEPPKQEPGEE